MLLICVNYYCVAARSNQQAALCQRHSHVQTGSKDLLQTDQRPATNHRHRVQGLPARGVKGKVRFNTNLKSSHLWGVCGGRAPVRQRQQGPCTSPAGPLYGSGRAPVRQRQQGPCTAARPLYGSRAPVRQQGPCTAAAAGPLYGSRAPVRQQGPCTAAGPLYGSRAPVLQR